MKIHPLHLRDKVSRAAWPRWPSLAGAAGTPAQSTRPRRSNGRASSASWPSPTCTAPTRNWPRCCARPGIVDAQDRWAAGRTHVVSLGDLLDRGADSRKVMDLLMRLQGEAAAAGGQVHVVLGNHEAMNVLGDLRYVDPGEYAAYADMESAGRARGNCAGVGGRARPRLGAPRSTRSFRRATSAIARHSVPQGKYGQWLLALPVAIVRQRHAVHARRALERPAGHVAAGDEPALSHGADEYLGLARPLRAGRPAAGG